MLWIQYPGYQGIREMNTMNPIWSYPLHSRLQRTSAFQIYLRREVGGRWVMEGGGRGSGRGGGGVDYYLPIDSN